jgi:hypothetical protein
MPIRRHSAIAHVAWHDLVGSLKDERIADIRGAPSRVERNGRVYWYDGYRVGADVRRAYIGEDNPELQARLARFAELKADREARRRDRARIVRLLRAEGFVGVDPGTGSLLSALAEAGTFRLGGTIVGTLAFRLYEGVLGVKFAADEAAQTGDIDIASFERLSLALADTVSVPLATVLRDFDFEAVDSLERGKVWRWRQTRSELLVEFLTPSFDAEEGVRPLAALKIHAQSLHYLNYLIAEPIPAAVTYRSGVLVQIPRPERFAIHKLIVADRRNEGPDGLRARKDRRQAAMLIEILAEDRQDDLADALADARGGGPRWRKRIESSLELMPQTRALLAAIDR